MIFVIDSDEAALAAVAAALAPEEVVTSADWTGLASRLALADPTSDVLILDVCRAGTPGDQLWRLLGHHATGVPTVLWAAEPSSILATCSVRVVPKAAGIQALLDAVASERRPRGAAASKPPSRAALTLGA